MELECKRFSAAPWVGTRGWNNDYSLYKFAEYFEVFILSVYFSRIKAIINSTSKPQKHVVAEDMRATMAFPSPFFEIIDLTEPSTASISDEVITSSQPHINYGETCWSIELTIKVRNPIAPFDILLISPEWARYRLIS